MGQHEKKEAMGKLIRIEKPHILLIQEKKLQGNEDLREMKKLWKSSSETTLNARGALGGICTMCNTQLYKEEQIVESTH